MAMNATVSAVATIALTAADVASAHPEERVHIIQRFGSSESLFYGHFQPAMIYVSLAMAPIWWAVGIPGNLVALVIWLQPKMRHSSGFYLATLAAMDILFLAFNVLFELTVSYSERMLNTPVLCELNAVVYIACQYASPVLMLGYTLERYVSVCHPFKFTATLRSKRCTLLTISLLVAGCFLLASVQGYFWLVTDNGFCDLRDERAVRSAFEVWTWVTEAIVFGLIPLAVLLLNVLVVLEMKKISALEKRNMRTRSIDRRSTTLMLLCVSFYQIFTVLPATITYSLHSHYDPAPEDYYLSVAEVENSSAWRRHLDYALVNRVIVQLSTSHYAINFYIYLLTGKLFRRQLQELAALYCCRCAATASVASPTSGRRQQLQHSVSWWSERWSRRSSRGTLTRSSLVSNRGSFKTALQLQQQQQQHAADRTNNNSPKAAAAEEVAAAASDPDGEGGLQLAAVDIPDSCSKWRRRRSSARSLVDPRRPSADSGSRRPSDCRVAVENGECVSLALLVGARADDVV